MATEKQKLENEEFVRQMTERTAKFNREMNVLVRRDKLAADKAVANAFPSRVARKSRKANLMKQTFLSWVLYKIEAASPLRGSVIILK